MRPATLLLLTFLATNLVWAQDAPKRKSGLWEITRTTTYTQEKPKRIQVCVDEASDNALQQVAEGMRGETCAINKLSQDGDKLVVDATCTLGATTAQTHAVISGKFDSSYTIDSKSTYKPPLAGTATGHARLVARWTGACAAGLHPGESILDSGVVSNSSGAIEAASVKPSKPDASAQAKSKQTGKASHAGKPGATPRPYAKGVAPAAKAKSATPAPAGTAPAPKSATPAPTGTPPAAKSATPAPAPTPTGAAPAPTSTPDKNPAPSQ